MIQDNVLVFDVAVYNVILVEIRHCRVHLLEYMHGLDFVTIPDVVLDILEQINALSFVLEDLKC